MEQPLSRTASSESTRSWRQLSSASGASAGGQKARSSEPETGGRNVERPSVSVPSLGAAAIRQSLPARRPSKASDSSIFEYFGQAWSGSALDDSDATPTLESTRGSLASAPVNPLLLPDSFRQPRSDAGTAATESKRLSISSFVSAISNRGYSWSGKSSVSGSEPDARMDNPHGTTTATSSLSVTTSSQNGSLGTKTSPTQLLFPQDQPANGQTASPNTAPAHPASPHAGQPPLSTQPRRSRSRTAQRRISGSTATSSSPASREMREKKPTKGIIGVCALESKARSKPARNIFGKLVDEFEVKIFGDKIILDEAVENWPVCDFLISFFSDGFPLDKAIAYTKLRKPFCVNDLPMQQVLWDRRLCLGILDKLNVPTPKRIDVSRDGGPKLPSAEFAKALYERTGLRLEGPEDGTGGGSPAPKSVELIDDNNTIRVDGVTLTKPFVEKPVSGEDHNIHIYFHKKDGGGGRRLFRKINNKSSEKDETLEVPRGILEPTGSYIYEQFLQVENSEDVKAYTVGPTFCHAETRKSPVVDGLVKRNPSGKEVRYVTKLSESEAAIAAKISEGFGQRVCGFDLLRTGDQSYVIDVNGWSFVKDNGDYYDKAANILKEMFLKEIARKQRKDAAQHAAADAQAGTDSAGNSIKGASGHRKTLGKLFKSPSMSRVGNHAHNLQHMRQSNTMPSSPDTSLSSTPIASSPSFEKPNPASVLSPATITTTSTSTPEGPMSEPEITLPPAFDDDDDLHLEQERSMSEDHLEVPPPATAAQWKLKGVVSVIRHADRTPKQKFKYTFHSKPFVDLLKGHQAEVLLIGEIALQSVSDAVKVALDEGLEDTKKLRELQLYLNKKGAWPGTKVQIKPMFRKRRKEELLPGETLPEEVPEAPQPESTTAEGTEKTAAAGEDEPELLKNRSDSMSGVTLSRITAQDNNMVLDKLQLIIKWGGEPTHSARHQTQDMGANFRNDLLLMNRDVLDDVHIFSSSERRVTTSAQIFGASFLEKEQYQSEHISVRKDLLDDSNAAKDVMDKVKKKLKTLLRAGDKAPPQFAWPKDVPEPYIVVRQVVDLIKFHQRVMNHNFKKIESEAISSLAALNSPPSEGQTSGQSQYTNVNHIQTRWCCNEGPELFKERWEKLFKEFGDADKVDPSKISELYDTMKFDALHNRAFLEWVFTPDASFVDEDSVADGSKQTTPDNSSAKSIPVGPTPSDAQLKAEAKEQSAEKTHDRGSLSHRMGFRRKSEITVKAPAPPSYVHESYFKLYSGLGTAASKAQTDARLVKLREMYHLCKVLFDYIGPQEYGIESEEKLEIGLLTSLPLLKEIVGDLEELQASDMPKCFFYFTKESHIYTLLNCILEGGIKTKIERNAIPELDYLSQINFELYESENASIDDKPHTFNYSIRITLSPGCHAFAPLDVQLDSRHMIGFAPRRSLTLHQDWKEVLETLRAKFHTVKLPKSFVAIDLSEKVPEAFERSSSVKGKEHNMTESEERGRSDERDEDASHIPIADAHGNILSPGEIVSPERLALNKEISPAGLPPPAMDAEKE